MTEQEYYEQAVQCVKEWVLPAQRRAFEQCNKDLDQFYSNVANSDMYFGKVVEPGRVYELGYPKCTCHLVKEGKSNAPEHCECSRQSIIYILKELLPDKQIQVEIMETVLRGSNQCRFRIYVD